VLGGQRRGARTDAVETILKERPGEGMSPEELAEELARRGVELRSENPPRAARAAANRARERNPEVVLVRGRFMWRPSAPTLPSQPTLPEDSG